MSYTFNEHTSRYEYPFMSADGNAYRVFTDAVDDLVLWISDMYALPVTVTAYIDSVDLKLEFVNNSGITIAYATYGMQDIRNTEGSICGYIIWNVAGCSVLKSALEANDPQPWGVMYVSPSACVPIKIPKMSVITVNNTDNSNNVVYIDNTNDNLKVVEDDNGGLSLNIYSNEYGDIPPITSIRVIAENDGYTELFTDLNKPVWLLSEAECDVRVVTDDSITITEISNDKL